MPVRFEQYRARDGITPLSERYFNPIFQDIDTRIADLEDKKASYDEAVKTLTDFGLLRINEVLAPSMTALESAIANVEARRLELDAAITQVTQTLGEIVTRAYLDQSLADVNASVDARLAAQSSDLDALKSLVYAGI